MMCLQVCSQLQWRGFIFSPSPHTAGWRSLTLVWVCSETLRRCWRSGSIRSNGIMRITPLTQPLWSWRRATPYTSACPRASRWLAAPRPTSTPSLASCSTSSECFSIDTRNRSVQRTNVIPLRIKPPRSRTSLTSYLFKISWYKFCTITL